MKTGPGKRVYLVEDDHTLRLWLSIELGGRGFDVASFDSGRRFLQATETLAPGCVLSDLRMAGGDGFELLEGLRGLHARFPVILMSAYADIPIAVKAMKLGAVEFVEKPFSGDAIAHAIESILQRYSGGSAESEAEAAAEAAREKLAKLTPRERQVLDGVVAGRLNKTIAAELKISQRTVELHRSHLMEKLGLRNVTELVRLALLASGRVLTSDLHA